MKTTTKNPTTTTPTDETGGTAQALPFAEQYDIESSTLRDQETLRDLHAAIMGTSPSDISRGAEEASAAFAAEEARLYPNRNRTNKELKGKSIVRTPVSYTMPDGTIITRA